MSSNFKSNLPNLLTASRGFLVIIISILFFSNTESKFVLIYVLFLMASLSDYLDGKLARKWQVKTNFGIVFDSLFDKVFTFVMYILLIPYGLIHTGVFIALIFRDLLIDGLKNFASSKGKPISPKLSGKIKMVCQTLIINFGLLMLIFPGSQILKILLYASSISALIFSYFSAFLYISDLQTLKSNKNRKNS